MNRAQAIAPEHRLRGNFAQCIDPAWVQAGCPAASIAPRPAPQPALGVVVHERPPEAVALPTAPAVKAGYTARILAFLLDEAKPWRLSTEIAKAIGGAHQSNVSALLAQMRDRHRLLRSRGQRRQYEFCLTAKGRERALAEAAKAAAST